MVGSATWDSQRAILHSPPTLPPWLAKFADSTLQLEMQCSRPPTLDLRRASYPRIKHLDIFPPFCLDLSQKPSFCICYWKLVSHPSAIQSRMESLVSGS